MAWAHGTLDGKKSRLSVIHKFTGLAVGGRTGKLGKAWAGLGRATSNAMFLKHLIISLAIRTPSHGPIHSTPPPNDGNEKLKKWEHPPKQEKEHQKEHHSCLKMWNLCSLPKKTRTHNHRGKKCARPALRAQQQKHIPPGNLKL